MVKYSMDTEKIGQIIRHQIKAQETSLAKISDYTNISTEDLSQIERGEIPQVDQVLAVLSLLGLDVMIVPRKYRRTPEYVGFQRLREKNGEITPDDRR
jgi:transcriptional regulator with XRE-family HTH domain